ncbi:hypothetical protein Hanom_Chr09g00799011 [Helianthus anomalus]
MQIRGDQQQLDIYTKQLISTDRKMQDFKDTYLFLGLSSSPSHRRHISAYPSSAGPSGVCRGFVGAKTVAGRRVWQLSRCKKPTAGVEYRQQQQHSHHWPSELLVGARTQRE